MSSTATLAVLKPTSTGPASIVPSWAMDEDDLQVLDVATPTVLADLAEVEKRRSRSNYSTIVFQLLLVLALGLALVAIISPASEAAGTGVDDPPPAMFVQRAE